VFGSKPIGNQTGEELGEYTRATYQACYDVLNNIAVQSSLGDCNVYEVDLAEKMIDRLKSDDLSIFDRGYASYLFMASMIQHGKPFIIPCSRSYFTAAKNMFDTDAPDTMTVLVDAPAQQKKTAKKLELPLTIKIRLVKVILSTGEIEVLATSLLNENEIFFSKIKGRLGLENFTGKTVESIKQDFWSTIFISNLETIMTEKTEEKMNYEKPAENKQVKINKAVSFNAIKKMAFDIFFNEKNKDLVLEKLDNLFRMNPVLIREDRGGLRKKISDTKSLNFQKRARKHVF
jgi:hypothetical protein